jgi:hypothetical protein
MSSRTPARAVARTILFVLVVASASAMCTASSGNIPGGMQICGAGIGAAVLVTLAGTVFVMLSKRTIETGDANHE